MFFLLLQTWLYAFYDMKISFIGISLPGGHLFRGTCAWIFLVESIWLVHKTGKYFLKIIRMCALISFKFLYQFSCVGGIVIYKQLSTKEWRKIRNKGLVLNLDRNSLEVYCVQNPRTLNLAISTIESIIMFIELTLIVHNNFSHPLNYSQAWCSSHGCVLLSSPFKRDPVEAM